MCKYVLVHTYSYSILYPVTIYLKLDRGSIRSSPKYGIQTIFLSFKLLSRITTSLSLYQKILMSASVPIRPLSFKMGVGLGLRIGDWNLGLTIINIFCLCIIMGNCLRRFSKSELVLSTGKQSTDASQVFVNLLVSSSSKFFYQSFMLTLFADQSKFRVDLTFSSLYRKPF